jgi:hypothetical protein
VIKRLRQEINAVISEVERRIDLRQSREQISREVTYEDRIHTCVNGWTGVPDWLVKVITERSVERVYDGEFACAKYARSAGESCASLRCLA